MAEAEDLHARLEALEKRLAEHRAGLAAMTEERRRGLGALLEALSEQLDAHDRGRRGERI